MKSVHEVLVAAWALIDAPAKWTQGSWARANNGFTIMGDWSKAVSYDSSGALRRVTGVYSHGNSCQFRDAYNHLEATLHKMLGRKEYLTVYNDTHTWEEVSDLWQQAITAAAATFAVASDEPNPTIYPAPKGTSQC